MGGEVGALDAAIELGVRVAELAAAIGKVTGLGKPDRGADE